MKHKEQTIPLRMPTVYSLLFLKVFVFLYDVECDSISLQMGKKPQGIVIVRRTQRRQP